jgi:hypothetical protein
MLGIRGREQRERLHESVALDGRTAGEHTVEQDEA